MNKQEIISILSENNLSPNKKFGQNFLCNNDIVKRIVNSAELTNSDSVLEIGPGLGCMTEQMLTKAATVNAVEIDAGLYRYLEQKFSYS